MHNRAQCVSINNCLSKYLPVILGVPQESILGPLLFLVYINDLSSAVGLSDLFIFADDMKCFMKIKSELDIQQFQNDLSLLSQC